MEDAPRQLADPPTTHNLSGELEMGLPQPKSLFTVDEYLAFERKADERHYYLDGEIFAMAGENDAHGIITVNVVVTLGSQLKGSPCQARTKDTKVRSGPIPESGRLSRGLFTYPDILVVCGEPLVDVRLCGGFAEPPHRRRRMRKGVVGDGMALGDLAPHETR